MGLLRQELLSCSGIQGSSIGKSTLSVCTYRRRMVRSAQEEKKYQLSLGIGFAAAAAAVILSLALRLGYCCEWFGLHLGAN